MAMVKKIPTKLEVAQVALEFVNLEFADKMKIGQHFQVRINFEKPESEMELEIWKRANDSIDSFKYLVELVELYRAASKADV